MIYRFERFELDTEKVELRDHGEIVAVEPQVFTLLLYLIANRDRVVSKDEIVSHVWEGRFVSDSAVSSRIKSARQALGDDGSAQRLIRTVHRVGFRFVGDVSAASPARAALITEPAAPAELITPQEAASRPAIAVLPFRLVGVGGPYATIADALPDELIAQLSRLRWLFVIARGSTFRFNSATSDMAQVRNALNVRYCLSGVVELRGKAMNVAVELSDTESGGVVWGENFRVDVDGVHDVREEIVSAVINALELQIPLNEARRARLKSPEHLDAWSAYHLGLQHMFRFNKTDNDIATGLFERAVAMEPDFARAYAGLSFTRFQDAFLHYVPDIDGAANLARRYAEQSLEHDPLDPFGNFTMGRSFWLKGDLESSLPWLERANTLNPNYAQGRYALAFAEPFLGNGERGQAHADAAIALSPLDPLLYAMRAARAFSHIVRGDYAEGARWVDLGARSPGAHKLIRLIAMTAHHLNGDDAQAQVYATAAREMDPTLSSADFFRAFPIRDAPTRKALSAALEKFGF